MAHPIRLFRGSFGHVSILHVASDLVTHAHGEAHIILWLDGTAGAITVGREVVRPDAGTAVAINAFEPHSHCLAPEGAAGCFLAFYIDPTWLRARYGGAAGTPFFANPSIRLESRIHGAALSMRDLLLDGEDDGDLAAYEVERFLDSVLDAARASPPGVARRARAAPDFRVRKAVEMMKANVTQRQCFDEIARGVGLSRPHFFALFREQMNLTPNVFWNTLRMAEAVRQLQISEDPLIEVALNLGFTSQGNFSRFFRDHAGVPPTAYRSAVRAVA